MPRLSSQHHFRDPAGLLGSHDGRLEFSHLFEEDLPYDGKDAQRRPLEDPSEREDRGGYRRQQGQGTNDQATAPLGNENAVSGAHVELIQRAPFDHGLLETIPFPHPRIASFHSDRINLCVSGGTARCHDRVSKVHLTRKRIESWAPDGSHY